MTSRQALWEQLQRHQKRGDLVGQFDILRQALQGHPRATPQQLRETLDLLVQNARRLSERQPPDMFCLDQAGAALEVRNPFTNEVLKKVPIPREPGFIPHSRLSWTETGTVALLAIEPKAGKLDTFADLAHLTEQQQGLVLETYYPCLNVRDFEGQFLHLSTPFLRYGAIPLESVPSLPLELFASHRHPVLAVSDRGSRKLHLVQRDNHRLVRSWKIGSVQSKKSLSVAFHPDGKRIFATAYEEGLLVMIDRQIALKKLPVKEKGLLGSLVCSPSGDWLYMVRVNPETRRPDLLVLDTVRFQVQQCLALEGEACSTAADPSDLLILSREGRWGILMVSRNQPSLFTPTLVMLDLEAGQLADQQILSPQNKPIALAIPTRMHFPPEIQLLSTLIQSQLVSENEILSIFGISQA